MTFAPPNTAPLTHMQIMDAIEGAGAKMESIRSAVGEVIFGQEEVVANSMITILSGGHLLLVGLPGLAKTRLVTTLGKLLGLECKRIQCTPDLMPSDIIGAEVLEEVDYGKRNFRFVQGPIFTQLLMVDEINRASPRTQSALLQAMQEHSASVAGREHALPAPFHVLATQNPLEQEGTYPLPEAQLDRFLMQVDITYPSIEAERKVLLATVGTAEPTLKSILNATELKDLHSLVRRIPLSEKVLDGILGVVRQGRPESTTLDVVKKYVSWGPGPRACQALSLAARARALVDGRFAPSMEDVIALIRPVLQHRMALSFAARAEGIQTADVLKAITTHAAGL